MRYQIAQVQGMGLGLIIEQHTYYAIIEFRSMGHRWQVIADTDDYDIVQTIGLGFEEIT